MTRPVFVSASVPDPRRPGQEMYAETADNVAIRDAITALVQVVTPVTTLVFGGHPAITPMVARVAGQMNTLENVTIYQSAYFEPMFPRETRAFRSLRIIPARGDRDQSLEDMRAAMLKGPFEAAFFIGGMLGVEEEFRALQGSTACYPIATTGGAALNLAKGYTDRPYLFTSYDYVPLFRRLLGVTAAR